MGSISYGLKGGQFPVIGEINNMIKTYNAVNNSRLIAFIEGWSYESQNLDVVVNFNVKDTGNYDLVFVSSFLRGVGDSTENLYPKVSSISEIKTGLSVGINSGVNYTASSRFYYESNNGVSYLTPQKGTIDYNATRYSFTASTTDNDLKIAYHPTTTIPGIKTDPVLTMYHGTFIFLVRKTPVYLSEIINNNIPAITYNTLLNFLKDEVFTLPLNLYRTFGTYSTLNFNADIGIGKIDEIAYSNKYQSFFSAQASQKDFLRSILFCEINQGSGIAELLENSRYFNFKRQDFEVNLDANIDLPFPYTYATQNPNTGLYSTRVTIQAAPGVFDILFIDTDISFSVSGSNYSMNTATHVNLDFMSEDINNGNNHFTRLVNDAMIPATLIEMSRAFRYMANNRHSYLLSPNKRNVINAAIEPPVIFPNIDFMTSKPSVENSTVLDIGIGYISFHT